VLTGWLGAGKTTTLTRWLEAAAEEKSEHASGKEKRAPPRVRLIINDVGASAIDAAVLSKAEIVPAASLVSLTAGCACCSLQAELVDAVAAAAADARDFASSASPSSSPSSSALLPDSWLFIECTGLALPSPVANAVAEGVRRAANGEESEEDDEEEPSLEAVVAVVDASTFAAGLAGAFDVDDDDDDDDDDGGDGEFVGEEEGAFEDEEVDERGEPLRGERFPPRDFAADEGPFEELAGVASPEGSVADLLASQVEAADVVLLNKADAVSLEALEEARALVAALNPGAAIVEAVRGDVPPSSLLGRAAAAAASPPSAGEGEGSQKRRRRRGVAGWAAALAAAAAARRSGGGGGGGGKEKKEEEGAAHSHSHSHEEEGGHHHHHHRHGDENKGDLHPSAHGISSFVFHSSRPFHPQRLLRALEDDGGGGAGEDDDRSSAGGGGGGGGGPWKGVVRSKGFFWLATRPKVAGLWQAAGGSWVGDPSHLWERGGGSDGGGGGDEASPSSSSSSSSSSPQQELVFIGNHSMNEGRVREALESALLTDEEMRGGEESWSRFEDELPQWELEG
jgi:G3E family GTPase